VSVLPNKLMFAVWLAAGAGLLVPRAQEAETLRILGTSRVTIHVGKAGAFGFVGHAHEVVAPVTGSVRLDRSDLSTSEVRLSFDGASLRVTGEGEPAQDVPEVQRVMLSERVLDVSRYPTIHFHSRRVTTTGTSGTSVSLSVEGELSLHGVTKPCVVPVHVTWRDGSLTAEGTTTIKQSDFGIQPVTGAGGTIRVKDALEVSFAVHAAR
jgi:polyisoprenoid-binding protein YceI